MLKLDILDDEERRILARGLAARRSDDVLDALLEEFDLDLVDSKEWSSVYWFVSRVARTRKSESEERSGSWRESWTIAWADVSEAIHLVSLYPLCRSRCI